MNVEDIKEERRVSIVIWCLFAFTSIYVFSQTGNLSFHDQLEIMGFFVWVVTICTIFPVGINGILKNKSNKSLAASIFLTIVCEIIIFLTNYHVAPIDLDHDMSALENYTICALISHSILIVMLVAHYLENESS